MRLSAPTHHLLHRHRGDATERGLGDGAREHSAAQSAAPTATTAATTTAAHCAAEDLAEQSRLLLVDPPRHLGKVGGILEPVVLAVHVLIGEADPELRCPLLDVPAELHSLVRRQAAERVLRGALVDVRR